MSSLTVVTAPTIEPVTLGEVKEHCRVDDDHDDAYLSMLLTTARQWLEEWTDRAMINTVYAEVFSLIPDPPTLADTTDLSRRFPSRITLRRAIVQSVASIVYIDTSNVSQTWTASEYRAVSHADRRGWIELTDTGSWPEHDDRTAAVTVTYTAGYGTTPGAVPDAMRLALLQAVAGMYEHREPALVGETPSIMNALGDRGSTVEALLRPYRVLV